MVRQNVQIDPTQRQIKPVEATRQVSEQLKVVAQQNVQVDQGQRLVKQSVDAMRQISEQLKVAAQQQPSQLKQIAAVNDALVKAGNEIAKLPPAERVNVTSQRVAENAVKVNDLTAQLKNLRPETQERLKNGVENLASIGHQAKKFERTY